jgi:hypothetical protein
MDNGDKTFRGAVPIGGVPVPSISCIWHYHEGIEHPPDAPPHWENPDGQWVIELAALFVWQTVNLTQLLAIANTMAKHLSEVAVQVEALDAILSA